MCTPIERHGVREARRLQGHAGSPGRRDGDSGAANDDIDDATVISSIPFTDDVNTEDATRPDDPDCFGNGLTVWYRFKTRARLTTA